MSFIFCMVEAHKNSVHHYSLFVCICIAKGRKNEMHNRVSKRKGGCGAAGKSEFREKRNEGIC